MRTRSSPFANVKWFEAPTRRRSNRKASPNQIAGLRLHEFCKLFEWRYGGPRLPDDDAGRDDIEPVLHHIAGLRQPVHRATRWLHAWAPWMTGAELQQTIAHCLANARAWSADQLAWRYRVTREERARLRLTTIGAIDFNKGARTKRRKARDRARKAAARMAAGIKARKDYERAAIERAKPWIAQGIGRRTWYRRRNAARGTSPATA